MNLFCNYFLPGYNYTYIKTSWREAISAYASVLQGTKASTTATLVIDYMPGYDCNYMNNSPANDLRNNFLDHGKRIQEGQWQKMARAIAYAQYVFKAFHRKGAFCSR